MALTAAQPDPSVIFLNPLFEKAHFERLGYLSLNSNQRSNYQARELKSVFINCTGRYLRILAHRCYVNKYNLFNQVRWHKAAPSFHACLAAKPSHPIPSPRLNPVQPPTNAQVGIIAVNLLGEVAADEEQHHSHAEVQHAHHLHDAAGFERPPSSISSAGAGLGLPPSSSLPADPQDLAYQLSPFDPETTRQLAALTEAKEAAVRVEDYDTAKRLKVRSLVLLSRSLFLGGLRQPSPG